MHGQNMIAKPRAAGSYLVKEIFATIQGEGPFAGYPAIFVRFAGCNLACHFCDTDFEGGTVYKLDALAKLIASIGNQRLVVLTGGEPMLQDLPALITHSLLSHKQFQIETAGSIVPYDMLQAYYRKPSTSIVCSPKTPKVANSLVPMIHAWKYVIRAGETASDDGLPTRSAQTQHVPARVYRPFGASEAPVYVQPCDSGNDVDNMANLAETVRVALKYGYRLSLQIHKLIGLP